MQSLRTLLQRRRLRPWPERPVPITFVITDLDVGGAERALVNLVTRLDRTRWRPSVICLGPEAELATALQEAKLPVVSLAAKARAPLRSLRQLIRAMRRTPPAIVQSFLFHANLAAKLAAPFAGRPWVVGGIRVAEGRNSWHLSSERRTQKLSAGWVCVSEGVRRHAIAVGHVDPDRLVVIANGIDVSRFDGCGLAALPTGLPEGRPVALFVGRVEPQKGLPFLFDAFERVSDDFPTWTLAIVGDGPDAAQLTAKTQASPVLRDRVLWLGRRADVDALMRSAEFLVLPSLWEGMPNVVLEAMAARKAVVATRVEGTEDLVVGEGPDRTGWLVPQMDEHSLADALSQAMGNAEQRAAFGEKGRLRIERHFTNDRVVAAYETVWAACLGLDLGPEHPRSEFELKLDGGDAR